MPPRLNPLKRVNGISIETHNADNDRPNQSQSPQTGQWYFYFPLYEEDVAAHKKSQSPQTGQWYFYITR